MDVTTYLSFFLLHEAVMAILTKAIRHLANMRIKMGIGAGCVKGEYLKRNTREITDSGRNIIGGYPRDCIYENRTL